MRNDPDLAYRRPRADCPFGGCIKRFLADEHGWRWAFTSSNAASRRSKDYADLEKLDDIVWDAVHSDDWAGKARIKEAKQAEFLMAESFPWKLITRIGVRSRWIRDRVLTALQASDHRPAVEIKPSWYYQVRER